MESSDDPYAHKQVAVVLRHPQEVEGKPVLELMFSL